MYKIVKECMVKLRLSKAVCNKCGYSYGDTRNNYASDIWYNHCKYIKQKYPKVGEAFCHISNIKGKCKFYKLA